MTLIRAAKLFAFMVLTVALTMTVALKDIGIERQQWQKKSDPIDIRLEEWTYSSTTPQQRKKLEAPHFKDPWLGDMIKKVNETKNGLLVIQPKPTFTIEDMWIRERVKQQVIHEMHTDVAEALEEQIEIYDYINALEEMEFYSEAILEWQQLLEENPQDGWLQYRLGNALAKQGLYDEAEEILRQSLSQVPDNEKAKYLLVEVYRGAGREEEAKNLEDKLIAIESAKQPKERLVGKPYNGKLIEMIAEATEYEDLVSYEAAADRWKQLLIADPQNPEVLYRYGQVQLKRGHYDEAEGLLCRSLNLRPDCWNTRLCYAQYLVAIGSFCEALTFLEQLDQECSGDPSVLMALSHVYENLGYPRTAYCKLREVKNNDPCDCAIDGRLHRLRKLLNPSFDASGFYSRETQNSLLTHKKSARPSDWGITCSGGFPQDDGWVALGSVIYGYSKEENLVVKGDNYRAEYAVVAASGDYQVCPGLRIIAGAGYKKVWKGHRNGDTFFPFRPSDHFEPYFSIQKELTCSSVVLNGYFDSFIAKRFSQGYSRLIKTRTLEGSYAQHMLTLPIEWGVDGFIRSYQDRLSNKEEYVSGWLRVGYPECRWVYLTYQFQYGHFNHTSPDYYSFNRWIENGLRATLRFDQSEYCRVEVSYYHGWSSNRDLSVPVSTPVIVGSQFINVDRVEFCLEKQMDECFKGSFKGYYDHNSIPFNGWGARGEVSYVF